MKHKLRSYQQVLCVTMEECGELTQACSKYLRFGNTEEIKKEAGDVLAMIDLLVEYGFVTKEELEKRKLIKFDKLTQYSDILWGKTND